GAFDPVARLAHLLDGGEEEADQDGDDRDHHQQLDQREGGGPPARTGPGRGPDHGRGGWFAHHDFALQKRRLKTPPAEPGAAGPTVVKAQILVSPGVRGPSNEKWFPPPGRRGGRPRRRAPSSCCNGPG